MYIVLPHRQVRQVDKKVGGKMQVGGDRLASLGDGLRANVTRSRNKEDTQCLINVNATILTHH